jgi:flavodoxin
MAWNETGYDSGDGGHIMLDDEKISRRTVLKAGIATGIGIAGLSMAGCAGPSSPTVTPLPTTTTGAGGLPNMEAKTMVSVIYYSMTGNTKKMAQAIAEELGISAVSVKDVAEIPADGTLFLGSGCYGSKPGEDMTKFIESNDFGGRKVAVFGTSGGGTGKETQAMADALRQKGADVLGSYYTAGSFLLVVSYGHPDSKDLDGARAFARQMAELSS